MAAFDLVLEMPSGPVARAFDQWRVNLGSFADGLSAGPGH